MGVKHPTDADRIWRGYESSVRREEKRRASEAFRREQTKAAIVAVLGRLAAEKEKSL